MRRIGARWTKAASAVLLRIDIEIDYLRITNGRWLFATGRQPTLVARLFPKRHGRILSESIANGLNAPVVVLIYVNPKKIICPMVDRTINMGRSRLLLPETPS